MYIPGRFAHRVQSLQDLNITGIILLCHLQVFFQVCFPKCFPSIDFDESFSIEKRAAFSYAMHRHKQAIEQEQFFIGQPCIFFLF